MEGNLITLALLGFVVFSEIRNYIERVRLIDRIMARTYGDFISGETERAKMRILEKQTKDPAPTKIKF